MMDRKKIYFIFTVPFVLIVFSFAQSLLSLAYANSSVLPNVIISKVGYNPEKIDLSEQAYEWFELYNPTANAIDMSNWTIAEDASNKYFIFPENTFISSGARFFVVNNKTEFLKQHVQLQSFSESIIEMSGNFCVSSSGCLRLNNSQDSLTLKNSASEIIDFVGWEKRSDIFDSSLSWNLEVSDGEFICRKNSNDTNLPSDFMAPCMKSILSLLSPISPPLVIPIGTPIPLVDPVQEYDNSTREERNNRGTGGKNPLVVERLRRAGITGISYETIGSVVYENVVIDIPSVCNYNNWLCDLRP